MSSVPMQLGPADETNASLQLVAREIAAELNEARLALEAYAERPEERGLLDRFAGHLHLGRGALRIAEVYGGSLLAEEMEHVAHYVAAHASHGSIDTDGLDALMRAMEQLPAYLDRVASGGRDVPLALLPLLNDLRAVRGGALLSEGTLLMLNLHSDEPARPIATGPAGEMSELAKRLRPRFQRALLGWIRGDNVEQQLGAMSEIAEQFETASASQPVFQLWWVVGSILEGLRQRGLEGSVSIKRLLGQVDRELRRLQDTGEERYSQQPPLELLNNLLFYVARATTQGPRVTGVRRSFRLDELLPVDERIDEARETLSAPSVRLMRTVAAAIREDLTRVKDVLDIFVRKGANQVEDLVPQLEMLRKISDTLGVLGLGALRDRVQGEIESLRAIVDRRSPPDDAALLGIAAALIEVEDSLDGQLVRLILPEAGPQGRRRAAGRGIPAGAGRGAARMHRQHGADQGGRDAGAGRAGGGAGARPGAAARARHHRGPADARPAARRRGHGGYRRGAGRHHATGARRACAAPARAHGRRDRRGRVLHGDAPGRPAGSLQHARERGELPRIARSVGQGRCAPRSSCRGGTGAATPAVGDRERARDGGGGSAARPGRAARRRVQRRLRVRAPVHRGGPRERRADRRALPAMGAEPARDRGPARRAPLLPHAQGKRTHGRRAAARRVRLEHRESAQSRAEPDPDALAGDRCRGARCGCDAAGARRRARVRLAASRCGRRNRGARGRDLGTRRRRSAHRGAVLRRRSRRSRQARWRR